MATLAELVTENSSLTANEVEHLAELVAEWRLLADLSFADLLYGYQYVVMKNHGHRDI